MKYLFVCAIGPVQDFIATARRSRDLWYGSWMLSELSKAAAKQIVGSSPNSLIFPTPANLKQLEPNSSLTVPNKVVAIVEIEPGDDGIQVKQAITKRLDELREDAFGKIKGDYKSELAIAQVTDLPEIYWVSVPFENDYPRARDQAEALMAARKATRDFTKVVGDSTPKSSLDGGRESVIPKETYPERGDSDEIKTKKIHNLYSDFRARQGEQLSGVDLLKRLGGQTLVRKFYSTSHMAALPFLEKLGDKKDGMLQEIRQLFKDEIGENDDGALVFESRLAEWLPAGKQQAELRASLEEILEKYAGEKRPNPYYALLAADGDNMGIVIDAQKDPATHRELSQALAQFALEAPKIIEKYLGVPIYAGGDDVLAYLPLHHVLECAESLEKVFRSKLVGFPAQKNGQRITPTLSVGIVIAHHLEPLTDVLELARQAERQAKQEKGKNGLAITLSKRGGADRTVSGKWGVFDQRLHRLIDFTQKNEISAGTAYELQDLHRVLSKAGVPREGLVGETLRIVARKHKAGGGERDTAELETAFKVWLEGDNGLSVDELAKEMILARMLAGDVEEGAAAPAEKEVLS